MDIFIIIIYDNKLIHPFSNIFLDIFLDIYFMTIIDNNIIHPFLHRFTLKIKKDVINLLA